MKTILISFLIIMLAISPATASVPSEWKEVITNDIDLYQISIQHQSESWAQENLYYLVNAYTNRIRVNESSLKELENKMKLIKNLYKSEVTP